MKKKNVLILIILALLLLPAAYYLLSPIWRVVEIQEESPLQVNDNMDIMTAAEKEQFQKEVDEAKEKVMSMDEEMDMGKATLLVQGEFKPRAHEVVGKAFLIQAGDSKILRFENFETINGPDLHIWLASSLGDEDYVDLGPIKATKGNVNYDVPAAVDTSKYNKVLIWCVPFRVLFSYAELE